MTWSVAWPYLLLPLLAVAWHLWWQSRAERRHRRQLAEAIAAGLNEPPTLHPVVDPPDFTGELADCPGVANLIALDLAYQQLDDGDLRRLIASPYLSARCLVNVSGHFASEATAKAFLRRFPNAQV